MEKEDRIQRIIASRQSNGRLTRLQARTNGTQNGKGAIPKTQEITEKNNTLPQEPTSEEMMVIMELVDPNKNFPSHPAHVGRLLREGGVTNFQDIQKLGKCRFKILTSTRSEKERIKKMKMEHQNLRIYDPKRGKEQTIVFVRGVPDNLGEEEIMENLEVAGEAVKVERILRRGRNGTLRETENLKLTIKGQQIPDMVKIHGCCFRAELYIFPVRQCAQCWRFGHPKKLCRSRPRCRKCGGRHDETDCGNEEKCVNCQRKHDAQTKDCPELARRRNILEEMKKKKVTRKRKITTLS